MGRPFASARSGFTKKSEGAGDTFLREYPPGEASPAARPVRRSSVTRLAAPGVLPFLDSPAFPLYPSARGGGRRRAVGVAAARAFRYAGGGERDRVHFRVQSVTNFIIFYKELFISDRKFIT